MTARRRWVPIVIGVAILLVFIGIGLVIAVTAWFQQNVQSREITEREAQVEFEAVRAKFASRPPLLELRNDVPRYTAGRRPTAADTVGSSLQSLNVIVWDPDDERLTRVTLPFWLVRMKSDPIEFSAYASGMDDEGVNLRPEDIEKYGAGIIIDAATRSGERVLVWAQ